LQKELDDLESEIAELEEKKLNLENELIGGVTDYDEIQKISETLKIIAEDLDEKSMRWMEIQEEA
jgi:ATP-binding cassette subfamily F protein uup